ncbi:MAG: hydrogenase nickel incorporation protein HypB [Planctomycetaceae bacterium]|nr:hydrogenase nickel incorporation protein HypB [Planctomycetaceae bacterium]
MKTAIRVNRDIQSEKKQRATAFREKLTRQGTLILNLVSSPGTGKTSLLEATARELGNRLRLGVLVGDLATDRDAQRLAPFVPVRQLTTGGACHLEISLVEQGWQELGEPELDILFIENVGNLVCPASHDLGEHIRASLLSTTEGDDKPGKYPKMFRTSQVMLLTKMDLLPHLPFCVEDAIEDARLIQPDLDIFTTSAISGEGIPQWCEYLEQQRQKLVANVRASENATD